jgi:GntR family transcriptional regulator
MPFFIQLVYNSATPVYRQIVEQVCAAIAAGGLREGEAMPTLRALAAELRINMNTVAKAYHQLELEGVIGARSTRGLFVLPRSRMSTPEEKQRRINPLIQALASEGFLLGLTREEILQHVTEHLDQQMSNPEAREARDDETGPGNRSGGTDEVLRERKGG